nr:MAG TPA: hypothetical protein [Inoviridae sp.]
MDTGILLSGIYLGSITRQRTDGKEAYFVAVACGLKSYEINMEQYVDFSKMSVGAPLLIRAEPYLYKGNLYWRHGQVCARN